MLMLEHHARAAHTLQALLYMPASQTLDLPHTQHSHIPAFSRNKQQHLITKCFPLHPSLADQIGKQDIDNKLSHNK
jgi:hypothetical protein